MDHTNAILIDEKIWARPSLRPRKSQQAKLAWFCEARNGPQQELSAWVECRKMSLFDSTEARNIEIYKGEQRAPMARLGGKVDGEVGKEGGGARAARKGLYSLDLGGCEAEKPL